jgi:hypothetical protein
LEWKHSPIGRGLHRDAGVAAGRSSHLALDHDEVRIEARRIALQRCLASLGVLLDRRASFRHTALHGAEPLEVAARGLARDLDVTG